jgi:hypothetical protein
MSPGGFVAAPRDGAVGVRRVHTHLAEKYSLDIHADSVQITYDVVTAHYSTPDMSIPQRKQGSPGDNDNQVPCFAGL